MMEYQVLFGRSMEDISTVREKASSFLLESPAAKECIIAPLFLASDLLLYPYQLYKLSLAGIDAVNIIVGALATKTFYLTKIVTTLKLQVIASVASEIQIRSTSQLKILSRSSTRVNLLQSRLYGACQKCVSRMKNRSMRTKCLTRNSLLALT